MENEETSRLKQKAFGTNVPGGLMNRPILGVVPDLSWRHNSSQLRRQHSYDATQLADELSHWTPFTITPSPTASARSATSQARTGPPRPKWPSLSRSQPISAKQVSLVFTARCYS